MNALDLQEIKSGAVFLYMDYFYSLTLATGLVIYLYFVIINDKLSE